MKTIKNVDENTIYKFEKKYNIPAEDGYQLKTTFFSFLFSLDSAKNMAQIKNHYQPLQALYYDNKGTLLSFQINCYAGGFPNLHWDRDSIFSTFVPKQQTPLDSIFSFQQLLNQIKPLSKSKEISIENYDYIVVVFWNRMMGRQSKRLIHFVQENGKLATNKRVKFIYLNSDNLYANLYNLYAN